MGNIGLKLTETRQNTCTAHQHFLPSQVESPVNSAFLETFLCLHGSALVSCQPLHLLHGPASSLRPTCRYGTVILLLSADGDGGSLKCSPDSAIDWNRNSLHASMAYPHHAMQIFNLHAMRACMQPLCMPGTCAAPLSVLCRAFLPSLHRAGSRNL